MTKIKALRDFLEKFFNYKSHGMTISEVLADVTENGEASGGGGYECKEELKTLAEETIVLEAVPEEEGYGAVLQDLSVPIKEKPNNIAVTFDGKAYQLPLELAIFSPDFWAYGEFSPSTEEDAGAPVFDNFPVFVEFGISENVISRCFISSNISGEHTIKIEIPEESVTVTPCFKKAVAKATVENNRTYIIPETTGETKTITDEIADLGEVTFYYLDVSVTAEPAFPVYFEVDGKLTTLNTMDEFQNFICTTPRAVINTLKSSEYALDEAYVFFREPGTHTVSMYTDKKSSDGQNVVVVEIEQDYDKPEPNMSFVNYSFDEVYSMMTVNKKKTKKAPPIVLFRIGSKDMWGQVAAFSSANSTLSGRKYIHVCECSTTTSTSLEIMEYVFSSDGTDDAINRYSIPFEHA